MPEKSRLMPISYYNPKQEIRLSAYADTIVLEPDGREQRLRAIRFGGYPEMVRAMSDAIYAGATLETEFAGEPAMLACEPKKYECHLSHDGIYAEATILSLDDADETRSTNEEEMGGQTNVELPPRKCILFCPAGDRRALYVSLTAAGESAAEAVAQLFDRADRQASSLLTQAETEHLTALLEKVCAALPEEVIQG